MSEYGTREKGLLHFSKEFACLASAAFCCDSATEQRAVNMYSTVECDAVHFGI